MDIAIKITLIASVILIGYNLSLLLTSYEVACEKDKQIKILAADTDSSEAELRFSNTLLTGVLTVIFAVLTYLSGLALWVVAVVAAKMVVSCCMSNMKLNRIMKSDVVDQTFFKLTKLDAVTNILFGMGVALILVA
ncbi:MAG: hypothetical protein MJY85_02780 [Fibrobacter sp.]|nr:hypothetical protein [Fibrobacter sp.]